MDFETEYQLQEFREVQNEYFDKNGKIYRQIIPHQLCERMLLLINQLEIELKNQTNETRI
jgi:hypothetical protein